MDRVGKLAAALVALAFLGALTWQESKIARLAPLIGDWDVQFVIKEPREVRGKYTGTATFSWEPNKQHIRAQGTLVSEVKTTHGTGFLSFDDSLDGIYRGAFVWADDGRILSLQGNFRDGNVVFDGRILSSDRNSDLKLRVMTTMKKDAVAIQVDAQNEDKWVRFVEIKMTRRK